MGQNRTSSRLRELRGSDTVVLFSSKAMIHNCKDHASIVEQRT